MINLWCIHKFIIHHECVLWDMSRKVKAENFTSMFWTNMAIKEKSVPSAEVSRT